MTYFIHICVAIVGIYFVLMHKIRETIPPQLVAVIVLVCFAIFLQLFIFEDAHTQGMETAKPKCVLADDGNPNASIPGNEEACAIPWDDKTNKWYRDVPFFLIWISALWYGLHTFKMGDKVQKLVGSMMQDGFSNVNSQSIQSALMFDFQVPDALKNVANLVFLIPLFGFVYYFYQIVIKKEVLMKPLPERTYFWERPLAMIFGLAFVPFLLLCTLNKERNILHDIVSNRITSGIVLFGAVYVVMWRLNGGMFLTKAQNDELQDSLAAYDDAIE
jgi:hypothetical protein